MCRHCRARGEMLKRIKDGEIGDLTMLRAYRMAGRTAKESTPRMPSTETSELIWQIKWFHAFLWASGGCVQRFSDPQRRRMLLDERRLAREGAGLRRPALPRRQRRSELRQLLRRIHVRRRGQAVPCTAARSTAATAIIPATATARRDRASSRPAAMHHRSAVYSRTRT